MKRANVDCGSRVLPCTKPSEKLDGKGKHIADTAHGLNDRRRGRIGFQLAPKPQHLDVDAAVEDVLVDTGCLQELLSRERALRSVEKRDQKCIFALGQRDRFAGRIGEASLAPVKLPAAEFAAAFLGIPLGRSLTSLPPPQYGADPGEQLPQAERLCDVVVGP